jgi:hypothetical protein
MRKCLILMVFCGVRARLLSDSFSFCVASEDEREASLSEFYVRKAHPSQLAPLMAPMPIRYLRTGATRKLFSSNRHPSFDL